MVGVAGIGPATPSLSVTCSTTELHTRGDKNFTSGSVTPVAVRLLWRKLLAQIFNAGVVIPPMPLLILA